MFVPRTADEPAEWGKLHNEELHNIFP